MNVWLEAAFREGERAENARFTGLVARPGTEVFLLHLFACQVLSKPLIYGFITGKRPKRSSFLTVLFSNSIGKSRELTSSTIIYLKTIPTCCYSSISLCSPRNNPVNYVLPHFDLWLFFICEFWVVPVLLLRQAQAADCLAWLGTITSHSAILHFTLLERTICSTGFRCWPPGWKQLH